MATEFEAARLMTLRAARAYDKGHKITKEAAMKSFYKAYERTQGKKYDKNLWKKIITKAYEHKILDPKKRYDKKTWNKGYRF